MFELHFIDDFGWFRFLIYICNLQPLNPSASFTLFCANAFRIETIIILFLHNQILYARHYDMLSISTVKETLCMILVILLL
jgi:hypothetical protein